MVRIRSPQEITQSLISFFRTAQPNLSTSPGSVARDITIDGPALELSKLYNALNDVSRTQSLRFSIGSDIDKWASNIGALRQRGAQATVSGLFTFSSLDADIGISKSDIVGAKNGSTFQVVNDFVVSPVLESSYKAVVAKYKADLDFLGIKDPYAVEILLKATAPGTQGNISKYNLSVVTITGINNVTNIVPAGGGKNSESDSAFKNRVLAIFSGSNIGTALGYKNTVLSDPSVIDAEVIVPGDPLMTRDGTQVSAVKNITDTPTIISEGTGGKADIIVFGARLQESSDSFIYQDKSNKNDPTNSANDVTLGQIAGDSVKTISMRRYSNLLNNELPSQPINNLVSVVGSRSGANFVPASTDNLGRVTGNYILLKDTGVYAGSPWGSDKLHWISNQISNLPEDKTKTSFNSQDPLTYADVLSVNKVLQNIIVTNENSKVSSSDRSSIQLSHFPCSSVTRVFNVTTGERYVITNQNPDGSGATNSTGRITITGATLPAVSDKLQVDYTWLYQSDPYYDFDNKLFSFNIRSVADSVDWGYSNVVRRERAVLTTSGSYLSAVVTHPISAIASVNVFKQETSSVTILSGRLAVTVSQSVFSVISVQRNGDQVELWNTINKDGAFNGLTIYLPTDTVANVNDQVSVVYNATDVYNSSTPGNFTGNTITIVPSAFAVAGTIVECNYITSVNSLLPNTLLSNLPAIRDVNNFDTNNAKLIGNQPTSHLFNNGLIIKNLRQAPSNLAINISGLNSINESGGEIAITGTTIAYAADIVFTASANGLKQDLSSAIRSFLALSSVSGLPSNVRVGRLVKMERVLTNTSLDVLSVVNNYDILGYKISDNSLVIDEALTDTTLSNTTIQLPSTVTNNANLPSIGDRLRVRFYLVTSNDNELVSFTKSGTLYSAKRYVFVDIISISSGFTSSAASGAIISITNFNQPLTKARYKAFYNYLSPKINERITVTSNYNKLIDDLTFLVEGVRPVNADVIIKECTNILVDCTMNIIVLPEFVNSSTIVKQNVADAVSSALNAQTLGSTIDSSDLINIAYTIDGVDRARVIFFNITGSAGSTLSIAVRKDQAIVANNVVINVESR